MERSDEIRVTQKSIKKKMNKNSNGIRTILISGSIEIDLLLADSEKRLSPLKVLETQGLPKVGDKYAESDFIFRNTFYTDADPKYDGYRNGKHTYHITYTITGEEVENKEKEEKEEQIISITLGTEEDPYSVPVDLDGKWNRNSAGEFFNDPLTVKCGIATFTFTRKEFRNPYHRALQFWNTINSSTLWGFLRHHLRCTKILPSLTYTNKKAYWNVIYELQFRALSWIERRVDCGYYVRGNGNTLYRAMNADGSPTDQPILLNGYGGPLDTRTRIEPVYKEFRTYQEADLSLLNLPNPFDEIKTDDEGTLLE